MSRGLGDVYKRQGRYNGTSKKYYVSNCTVSYTHLTLPTKA
ncbi:hypothetical protein JMUB7555_27380 [Staphylococcus aureus]